MWKLVALEIDKMEQLITLNIIALTRLARAAAPASVSRGAGTIVNISSIVAINPELSNGVDGGGACRHASTDPNEARTTGAPRLRV